MKKTSLESTLERTYKRLNILPFHPIIRIAVRKLWSACALIWPGFLSSTPEALVGLPKSLCSEIVSFVSFVLFVIRLQHIFFIFALQIVFCLVSNQLSKIRFSSLVICISVRYIARQSKFVPLKIDPRSSKLINKHSYNIFAIEWKCKLKMSVE